MAKRSKSTAVTNGRTTDGRFAKNNPHGFQKGVSGNPSGRPIDTKTPHVRALVQKKVPNSDEHTYGSLIAQRLVQLAMSGEIAAIREVFDRLEGRPRQPIELSVEDRRRDLVGRAIEALMVDAAIDRDQAIDELTRLNPEITQWIN